MGDVGGDVMEGVVDGSDEPQRKKKEKDYLALPTTNKATVLICPQWRTEFGKNVTLESVLPPIFCQWNKGASQKKTPPLSPFLSSRNGYIILYILRKSLIISNEHSSLGALAQIQNREKAIYEFSQEGQGEGEKKEGPSRRWGEVDSGNKWKK